MDSGSVVEPEPEVLEQSAAAPAVDQELLDRLGVDDPPFLAWIGELDTQPLLEEALARARAAVTTDAQLWIAGGALRSRSARQAAPAIARLVKRWQVEVLRIVCELLDYEVTLEERGGRLVIEGEKHGASGVHEYVSITTAADGSLEVRFEHFASDEAVATERAKLYALAQKLGVRLRITRSERAGQKIPPGTIHGLKTRGKA